MRCKIDGVNVKGVGKGIEFSPEELKEELSLSDGANNLVYYARETAKNILFGNDNRMLIITGPCSIHDEEAAIEYASRLKELQDKVVDTMYLGMRAYFEKPRTTVGWKGLINDPFMNNTNAISHGVYLSRRIARDILETGVPIGTELIDPIFPAYFAELFFWIAIGARNSESQTQRQMASGLSAVVGFKNNTEGHLLPAINGMICAASQHTYPTVNQNGMACCIDTEGNPFTHLILRGGGERANFDSVSVKEAIDLLRDHGQSSSLLIDCSHKNARKGYKDQAIAWKDVLNQRLAGNFAVKGMMLESNLEEGCQDNTGDLKTMAYGQSITDACISWETTEKLILDAHEKLLGQQAKAA